MPKLFCYNILTNTYIGEFKGYKDFVMKELYTYKICKGYLSKDTYMDDVLFWVKEILSSEPYMDVKLWKWGKYIFEWAE